MLVLRPSVIFYAFFMIYNRNLDLVLVDEVTAYQLYKNIKIYF